MWIWCKHMTRSWICYSLSWRLKHCLCRSSASLQGRLGKPATCLFVWCPFIMALDSQTKKTKTSKCWSPIVTSWNSGITLREGNELNKHERPAGFSNKTDGYEWAYIQSWFSGKQVPQGYLFRFIACSEGGKLKQPLDKLLLCLRMLVKKKTLEIRLGPVEEPQSKYLMYYSTCTFSS